jgi:hypothetical protein
MYHIDLKPKVLVLILAGTFCGTVKAAGLFQPYISVATGSWPEAVAIGDVNGDGRNDVVLTTSYYFDLLHDYKLFVFIQQVDGSLGSSVIYPLRNGSRPLSVAIGDMNGDGRADVIVGQNDAPGIEVLLQNASATLDPALFYSTPYSFKVRLGDFNNDGRLDVAGIDWSSDFVGVMLTTSAGTLAPPITYLAPHFGWDDLELGDVNNDELTDIIVMNGQGFGPNLQVLTQLASGGFSPAAPYSVGGNILTQGVGVGDINGDGRNDVVVSYGGNSPNANIGLFLQNSGGSLDAPPASQISYDIPEPVEVVDINLDGRKDVVVLHGGWLRTGIYLQQADGTLAPEELYPIPYASHYNPHGLAVGDINSDMIPDIVIADYNSGLVVLYGQISNQPPVVFDQSVGGYEDTPVLITLAGMDVNNDTLTFQAISVPTHGTLSGMPPNLVYTPNSNFYGMDSFTFKANDGKSDSGIATVTISIEPVNDAPIANADVAITTRHRSIMISALTNDLDVDGDALMVQSITRPQYGKASITPDFKQIKYTPKEGFVGTDAFTYTVTDGKGATATAMVSVKVIKR